MASQPKLQIAQILADLSDLSVAETDAATALLSAHRDPALTLPLPASISGKQRRTRLGHESNATLQRMLSDKARENNIRLRYMNPNRSASGSPGDGSPRVRSRQSSNGAVYDDELEPDLARAATLLELYNTRAYSKQAENKGLARMRANVEEVRVRYSRLVEGEK